MSYRQWIAFLVLSVLATLVSIASLNYLIDPLQQLRFNTSFPITLDHSQSRRLNPGIAMHYDYDSVVIGTSHARNFSLRELESELSFSKPVKLTMPAATAYEMNRLLQVVFARERPKKILLVLDFGSFDGPVDRKQVSFHEYLYQHNCINTCDYLLNFNTTRRSMETLLSMLIGKRFDKDGYSTMYESKRGHKTNQTREIKVAPYAKEYRFGELKSSFDRNLADYFLQNPDTDFTIIYPPYSIVAYKGLEESESLNDVLEFKDYVAHHIGSLPNVKIYDFQTARSITHNFSLYTDATHYSAEINSWMIDQIKCQKYRETDSNVASINRELMKQVGEWKASSH